MKKLLQFQLFLILTLSLFFIGCSEDDTDFALVSTTLGDEFPGSITGKVLWKGHPLLGVSITSDQGVSTVSGTDGSFILDNLSNGNHFLTFFKAGYFDTTLIEPILVNLKTETKLATDVNMVSLYSTIRGEVLDVNGSRLSIDKMAGIAIEGQANTEVALGGSFTLANVEAGTIKIRSVVSGLGFGETEVEVLPDTAYDNVQIQLAGVGGKVSGTITEGDSKTPVSGATVSVIENVLETVTDKDGTFELDNVPSTGEVSLTVKKPGTAGTTDTVSVVIGGVTVEEEGEVNVGALDLTKDPADTSALFGIQNGFVQADFLDPTHKVTIFSPVYLKDTASYDFSAFLWDIDADGNWDTVTTLPKIVIGKQEHWITSGVKYPVLGGAVAVSRIGGDKENSPVGRVNIEIKVPNNPAKIDMSTAPVDAILTEGAAYSAQIRATDLDKDIITYKLIEFPEGMTIDAKGAISWPAATLGAHRVKVTATDGKGISAGHAWTLTVPSPVTIDNVTGATSVATGESIVLSAATTSLITPVYYIWEIKPANESLYRVMAIDTVTTGTGSYTFSNAGIKENGATVRLTVDNGTNKQSQIWNLAVTGIVQTPFTNMLSATYWYSVTDETGSKATLSGLPTTLKWDVNILASTSSWGNVNSGPLTIDGTTKATYETAKSIRIVYRSTDEFSLSLPMPENEQYNWAGHDYLLRNTSGVWDSLEITIDTVNFKNLYGEPTAPFNKSHVTNMALNAYDTYPGVLGYIEVRRLELVGFTGTEFDEGGTVTSVIDSVSGSTTVVEGAALNLTAYANSSVKTPITYTWQLDGVTLKTTPSTTQYEDILNHTGLTVADNGKTLSLIVTNGIVTDTVKKVISVISGGDKLEKTVLFTGDITLNSVTDTVSKSINVTAGYVYNVETGYNYNSNFSITYRVVDAADSIVSHGGAFKAATGTYTVKFFIVWSDGSSTGPFTEKISIEQYAPLDNSLSGMWLLTSEYSSALGKTYSASFRADSADEVIEFRNDSIIAYTFSVYDNSVSTYGQLFAGHWYSSMNISNDGTTLTFSLSGAGGTSEYTYKKYTSPLSSITWQEQVFKVPANAIGTWYRSSESWNYFEFGVQDYDSSAYESGAVSDRIVTITADSIISYSNREFMVQRDARPVMESSFWNYGSMIDGKFHIDYVEYEDESEYGYELEVYTPYTGTVPPAEWSSITIPAISTPIGNETLSATLNSDTLWYKFAVTAGTKYTCSVTNTDYSVYMAIVGEDGKIADIAPNNLGGWDISKEFTSAVTGSYYLAITGQGSTASNIDVSLTATTAEPYVLLEDFKNSYGDDVLQTTLGAVRGMQTTGTAADGNGYWWGFSINGGGINDPSGTSIDPGTGMSSLFTDSSVIVTFTSTTDSSYGAVGFSLPGDSGTVPAYDLSKLDSLVIVARGNDELFDFSINSANATSYPSVVKEVSSTWSSIAIIPSELSPAYDGIDVEYITIGSRYGYLVQDITIEIKEIRLYGVTYDDFGLVAP